MKKTLLTILGAILVGFGLGLFFFKKFDTNIEALATSVKSIYAVQVGVYKNIDNAKDVANKMGGIVVLDNDYYRVYIDIIKDKEIQGCIIRCSNDEGNYIVGCRMPEDSNEIKDYVNKNYSE